MADEHIPGGAASAAIAEKFDPEDEYHPEPEGPPTPPAWMDGGLRIGLHTSISGHISDALNIAQNCGANALQIFSASPRMWRDAGRAGSHAAIPRGRFSEAEAAAFRKQREALQLGPLVVHANYLINLASPDRVLFVRSVQAFHDEIVRAVALGADYLVVHPGAGRGSEGREALARVAQAIRESARRVRFGRLQILLENTAGQGTALGMHFSELKFVLEQCRELPMGVCVDTCHLFAAGYDIRSAEGLDRTLQAIDATVGLERVAVVHVNDSKGAAGSRLDRHEHIGKGKIGLEAFRRIMNHPALMQPVRKEEGGAVAGRAFILETPIDKAGDDLRNVRTLWALAGREVTQVRGGGHKVDAFPPKKTRATKRRATPRRKR